MPNYRRNRVEGGCYFFTLNCLERKNNSLLIDNIPQLKRSIEKVKSNHPFYLDALVVLPEHMHLIMTLPPYDNNYSKRIRLIKSDFSKSLGKAEYRNEVRKRRNERGIWQRRFWEHTIIDDTDYERHMDYIHFNPVKHGYVNSPSEWPFSTYRRLVDMGIYALDWAGYEDSIKVGE